MLNKTFSVIFKHCAVKDQSENLGFYLNTQGKVSWVFLNNKNLVFVLPSIEPYEWMDFCFTTNATTYAVQLNNGSTIWGTKTTFENQSVLKAQFLKITQNVSF